MVPTSLERQVRQDTNDVLPVYEVVHRIDREISALDVAVSTVVVTRLRHGQRLDVIGDKLEQVSGELAEARTELNANRPWPTSVVRPGGARLQVRGVALSNSAVSDGARLARMACGSGGGGTGSWSGGNAAAGETMPTR